MTFRLRVDDPLLYRSLDTKRNIILSEYLWRQPKYTEVFEPAVSTSLPRQQINLATELYRATIDKLIAIFTVRAWFFEYILMNS